MKRLLSLTVNGSVHEVAVRPNATLLQALREDLGLTGAKCGCGEGDCGACAVLLNGVPVNSCLVLALEVEGQQITTIEGVADGNELHPIQQAFVDKGAVQCGFCTPGMILVGKAELERRPALTRNEARLAISGNLCRCTGYHNIVEALVSVGAQTKNAKNAKNEAGGEP